MIITAHSEAGKQAAAHNDDSNLHNDEIGENSGDDTGLAGAGAAAQQGDEDDTSNKNKGPKGEDL